MTRTAKAVRRSLALKDCRVGSVWKTRHDPLFDTRLLLVRIFFVKDGFVAYLHAGKGNKRFSTRMAGILKWSVFLALFEPRR